MTGNAQQQLRQSRPFETPAVEAGINVWLTADALLRAVEEVLKPAGLTHAQYNVLRILRGAGPRGLACGEIAARMITRDPDMTRLLDRMEKAGVVRRERSTRDRRVVTAQITPAGLRLLAHLDQPMVEAHEKSLGHLGARRLRALIDLLEDARAARK